MRPIAFLYILVCFFFDLFVLFSQRAAEYFTEEMEIRNALDDPHGHAIALCNLGHALVRAGQVKSGALVQSKAFILFKDVLHDYSGQARSFQEMAAAYAAVGSYELALSCFQQVCACVCVCVDVRLVLDFVVAIVLIFLLYFCFWSPFSLWLLFANSNVNELFQLDRVFF